MKKLLLVLTVVALASFLLVGCDTGTTPADGDDDVVVPPVVVEQAATITVAGQAIVGDKTYVKAADNKVTVKFTEAIPADKAVWVSLTGLANDWVSTTGDTARLEFVTDTALTFKEEDEGTCTPVCIYVKVGDICCTDENYSQVVVVDGVKPCADFALTFTDCGCPGENEERALKMSFTSLITGDCGDIDICEDCCSGVGDWKFRVIPDDSICGTDCDVVAGTGCAIAGTTACNCLVYPIESTITYDIDVSIKDKVGNEFTDTWTLTLDTDEVTEIVTGVGTFVPTVKNKFTIDYDNCDNTMCD